LFRELMKIADCTGASPVKKNLAGKVRPQSHVEDRLRSRLKNGSGEMHG